MNIKFRVFNEPLFPDGEDWPAALQLRDETRRLILAQLEEDNIFYGPGRRGARRQPCQD